MFQCNGSKNLAILLLLLGLTSLQSIILFYCGTELSLVILLVYVYDVVFVIFDLLS